MLTFETPPSDLPWQGHAYLLLDGVSVKNLLAKTYEWFGTQSLLLMRISVQPVLAVSPLKSEELFLHYRIPLDIGSINRPIKGMGGIAHIGSMEGYELRPEYLNE